MNNIVVDDGAEVHPSVILENCSIGRGVKIYPRCIVGSVPFFYRLPIGKLYEVLILEDAIIHAGTNINSGIEGNTVIGSRVKIDSNCHIAHDTVIGEDSLIAAGFVCGGFTTIGKRVRIGLGVTVKNRVTIADGAYIGMGAVITHDVSGIVIPERLNCNQNRTRKLMSMTGRLKT